MTFGNAKSRRADIWSLTCRENLLLEALAKFQGESKVASYARLDIGCLVDPNCKYEQN